MNFASVSVDPMEASPSLPATGPPPRPSGQGSLLSRPAHADWNKENVPLPGGPAHKLTSLGGTPKGVFKKPSALTQLRLLQRPLQFSPHSPAPVVDLGAYMEKDSPMLMSASPPSGGPRPLSLRSSPSTPTTGRGGPKLPLSTATGSGSNESIELNTSCLSNCDTSFLKRRQGMRGEKRSISMEDVEDSPVSSKRREFRPTRPGLPVLQRSFSEANAAAIRQACTRLDHPNLTSDTLRSLVLPVLDKGVKHVDLNTITCHTLARLMQGEFHERVASYRIIDARYTYEFVGGHIRGAENFGSWEEHTFFDEFLPPTMGPLGQTSLEGNRDYDQRHILIFHCEFSSQRGPQLLRELRKRDRTMNSSSYPALHYPEVYLLHNGYKEFYEHYQELCDPQAYREMAHPEFSEEERKFRKKSKSWAGGATTVRKASFTRLF